MDYSKIAIRCGESLKLLTSNNDLALKWNKDDCGNEVKNNSCCGSSGLSGQFYDINTYYQGYSQTNTFGRGNPTNIWGTFRIDKQKQVIVFSNLQMDTVSDSIYMEYVGVDLANLEVPAESAKAIQHYIHWHRNLFKEKLGMSREHERLYKDEVRKVGKIQFGLGIEDIHEIINKNYKLSPKGIGGIYGR
jgi:hypothetical protein